MALIQEFVYRALDGTNAGHIVKGTVEASSSSAVVHKLRTQGLTPLDVTPLSKTGLNREINLPGFTKRVKTDTLAVFTKQMAGLINAGLPLMRTLTILVEQAEDKTLQKALVAVQADVESGASFSGALGNQPDVFPPLMVSLVQVGESGGFLGDALTAVAETYSKEATLQNKIRSATAYPLVVLVVAIIGMLVMVTFIVPVFENMFTSIGSHLPLPTQIIVTISHNMIWVLPLLIVLVIAFTMWWRANKNTEAVRRRIDPIKLKLPLFGKLVTKIAVARFCRSLSMMLSSGVPLLNALSIVGKASNNWSVEQAVKGIQDSIRQGKSFAGPLAKAGVFPPMVAQMAAVGEESGTLADMLGSIADFYEEEVDTAADQLASIIEPVMIVGVGVLIGGMVISLYMPVFSLYGDLAKTG